VVDSRPMWPLPLAWLDQPITAENAAARAVELLVSGPQERAPDRGGAEVLTVDEMVRVWRSHRGHPHRVIGVSLPGRVARGFQSGFNTCPANASDTRRWAEHVAGLSS